MFFKSDIDLLHLFFQFHKECFDGDPQKNRTNKVASVRFSISRA
nr:hypothetical protein LRH_09228 [Lacticaseibacillus rhamnosus HN001]